MNHREDIQDFINPSRPSRHYNSKHFTPYRYKDNYQHQHSARLSGSDDRESTDYDDSCSGSYYYNRYYSRSRNHYRSWNSIDDSSSDRQNLWVTNRKLNDTEYEKTYKHCERSPDSAIYNLPTSVENEIFVPVEIKKENIFENRLNESKINYNPDKVTEAKYHRLDNTFSFNRTTNPFKQVSGWDVKSDGSSSRSPPTEYLSIVETDPKQYDNFDIDCKNPTADLTQNNSDNFSSEDSDDDFLYGKKQLVPSTMKEPAFKRKNMDTGKNIKNQPYKHPITDSYDDQRATNLLLFMLVKNKMPLNAVESESFQTFIKYLCPFYIIPDSISMTNLMLDKYRELVITFKTELLHVETVTLTADTLTDYRNIKYLSLSCHYIIDYEYKSVNIGLIELSDYLTADSLEKWILERMKLWNLKREIVIAVVSDWYDKIVKAVKNCFGAEKHLPFLINMLNTIPEKIFELDEVQIVMSKIKTIVAVLKNSEGRYFELENHAKCWIAMYKMLNTFKQCLNEIDLTLQKAESSVKMLDGSEMKIMEELLHLLKPFMDVIENINRKSFLTCSETIPIIKNLKKMIDALIESPDIRFKFKEILGSQFVRKFEKIEKVSLLAMATIFDPRYKKSDFTDKLMCIDTVNKITKYLHAVDEVSIKNTKTRGFQNSKCLPARDPRIKCVEYNKNEKINLTEPHTYLDQPVIQKHEDPLRFWKDYPDKKLATLALKYFTISISKSKERLSTNAQFTQTYGQLSLQNLQQLIFLNSFPKKYWYSGT